MIIKNNNKKYIYDNLGGKCVFHFHGKKVTMQINLNSPKILNPIIIFVLLQCYNEQMDEWMNRFDAIYNIVEVDY